MSAQSTTKAQRVTMADIEDSIVSEHYFTAADGRAGAIAHGTYEGRERPEGNDNDLEHLQRMTFCVLVLRNGFMLVGESACVSKELFDAAIGRKVAREDAIAKAWPLFGYALRERLARP